MFTRSESSDRARRIEQPPRPVTRERAKHAVREGVLEVLVGFGLIAASFLFDNPLSIALLGVGALVAGALQLFKGLAEQRELGAEPPEPELNPTEHPVTTAPTLRVPIEDSAYDAAMGPWAPWAIAGTVVAIVVFWWWSRSWP